MLTFQQIENSNTSAFVIEGQIGKGEMVVILQDLWDRATRPEKIKIYVEIHQPEGLEKFSSFYSDVLSNLKEVSKRIEKTAIVCPKHSEADAQKLVQTMRPSIDARYFGLALKEKAMKWLVIGDLKINLQ